MTNTYHCYQPVGSIGIYTSEYGLHATRGTVLKVVMVDHDDPGAHYGVIDAMKPVRPSYLRRKYTDTGATMLEGYERVDFFFVRYDKIDFCDSVTKETAND